MATKPQLNINDMEERQDDLTKEVDLTTSQRGDKLLRQQKLREQSSLLRQLYYEYLRVSHYDTSLREGVLINKYDKYKLNIY